MAGNGQASKSAEALLIRARDELDRLSAEFPGILQYRRELASIFNNLGRLGRDREQPELASESFRQAASLLKPLATKYLQVPDYRQNLAIVEFQLNLLKIATDPAGAEPALAQLLDDQETPYRPLILTFPIIAMPWGVTSSIMASCSSSRAIRARAENLVEKAVVRFQAGFEK